MSNFVKLLHSHFARSRAQLLYNKHLMGDEKSRTLDWEKVHSFVLERSNAFLESIGKNDVDWFLTDSNVKVEPHIKEQEDASKKAEYASKLQELKKQTLNGLLVTPPSPHLAVSNSNANSVNKTKPSILPISEEQAHHDPYLEYTPKTLSSAIPRRKNSVSSVASNGSTASAGSLGSSGGFFSKLKNKLHRTESQSSASGPSAQVVSEDVNSPQARRTSRSSSVSVAMLESNLNGNSTVNPISRSDAHEPVASASPVFKSNYRMESTSDSAGKSVAPSLKPTDPELGDPRLEEYIRFYRRPSNRSLSRTGSLRAENNIYPNSCIINNEAPPPKVAEPPSSAGKIGSLFRRMSVSTSSPSTSHQDNNSNPLKTSMESNASLVSTAPTEVPPQFKDIKDFKRVAFHSLTFLIDPPQQIPSRTPRKGNVEILPSGTVRINPLTEADKLAIEKSQKGLGGGLVVGGTGALGLIKKEGNEDLDEGSSIDEPLVGKDRCGEEDTAIDKHAKLLAIDKPMLHHVARPGYTVPVKKMALDLMYTRCCHLREILPIPAIAKQIPKGSMTPLPLLQLRNPTPTMIEIQTFADFIRIAPIICISLDGVSLSYEQFKILLSAMCAKKQLEKLSLRNTPIDSAGWSLLCWFLSRNRVINKLDITQCPPLSVNVLKKKKKKPEKKIDEETIVRMTCNMENRSDMDWSLFTATLVARGGIEELILTGCCITDLAVFELLIKQAVTLRTYKLGLAYNQITPSQLRIVMENWVLSRLSRGLDLGYNDMTSPAYINTFLELSKTAKFKRMISNSELGFLSLNATNLYFDDQFKEVYEKVLLRLSNLKYLDLSNNPKLFGAHLLGSSPGSPQKSSLTTNEKNDELKLEGISGSLSSKAPSSSEGSKLYTQEAINSYFCSKLPLFRKLVRLNLENCGLSSTSLIHIFETVPYCKSLAYLSVVGNTFDVEAGTALIRGLENSNSLITVDGDFNQLPEIIKERIGLHTMRNMELFFKRHVEEGETGSNSVDLKSEDSQEESIAEKLSSLLEKKKDEKIDMTSPEVVSFIKRIQDDSKKLKAAIADLFHLQWKNELSMEGKETLIKLLFLDSSLERGLKLIDSSLVENQETVSSSDLINMNLSEDEKNKARSDAHEKVQGDNTDPTTSLSVKTSSVPVSRTQSMTSLSNLNKEEGSVLKLLNISKNDNGRMFEDFSKFSGEEIRRKLIDVNLDKLDTVIDYLEDAAKKGISLKSLYQNRNKSNTEEDDHNLLDEIREKLVLLRESVPVKKDEANSDEKHQKEDFGTLDSQSPEGTHKNEEEIFNMLLSKFNQK